MYIEVNDVRYHVELTGEGPALLLLHGFTGSTASWEGFIPSWSKHQQVIAVDLLGHGQTDAPADPSRYRTEHAVRDLTDILDALHIDAAHVLGYSMGGRLALSLALIAPQRVRSLILESATPGIEADDERAERVRSDEALADRIISEGVAAFVDYWESIPLFRTIRDLPDDVQHSIRAQRLQNAEIGLAGSLRGMGTGAQPSWWQHIDSLSIPVQLIVGERDEKFVRIAQRMDELLPDSRLAVVAGAGHMVHVEQADFFDTIVVGFLKISEAWKMRVE